MLRWVRHSSISVVTLNSRGLLALTLPTAMEQPLLDLQRRLFRELGLISAMALPPLLPLLWTADPLPLESVREVARASTICLRLSGRAPEVRKGEVILPVEIAVRRGEPETPAPLRLLRKAAQKQRVAPAQSGGSQDPGALFPPLETVRLASAETPESADLLAQLAAEAEPIRGESEALTLTSLRIVLEKESAWWQHLYYEALAQRRVTVRN